MKKNILVGKNPAHRIEPIEKQNFYLVKSGETLESIARDLMLENHEYLREYHNKRCSFLDIIPENGALRFLHKLCIPDEREIRTINSLIREHGEGWYKQFPKGKIPFNRRSVLGDYRVKQTESDDGVQKSEYAYSLHFNHIKEEKGHYIHFSMSDFEKDGEEPGEKISNLASAFVKIIYPITLIVDRSGELTAAETHKGILEMMSEIESLKNYHQGFYASSHIDHMKAKMATPQIIYNSVKKILPIQFLFSLFYQADYNIKGTAVPYTDDFSWLAPASPVKMELLNHTLPERDSRFIEILQTGKSVDYRTVEELYNTDLEYEEETKPHLQSLTANHSAIYTLNAEDFSVQKIKAEFDIQIAGYEKSMTFELEKLAG
ncbi:hypothetical protein DRF65_15010 [Chryseobacterium pennae]|uniref:LysM domain-containing protein n=1 Tax=Chryseobacterium pennae TaxID=2258962 RepID=A0A3D9C6J2_9FLAO|nr:hypothetical protein [Chryseobacterium pennae]REC61500.1 hypothetical protein DRF65_15010 [Chryseobacterium pennae]